MLKRAKEVLTIEAQAISLMIRRLDRDFEVAVEEGASMIRLGTALFGPRAAARKAGLAGRPREDGIDS